MSVKVEFDDANFMVIISYNGTVTLRECKQAVEQGCLFYAHLMSTKLVLVDARELEMDLPFDEQIEFGKYLSSHPVLKDTRAAVLHKKRKNPSLVIDAVAFNGGYNLAEFSNEADARAWLKREI